jgi:hypothetical protein
MGASDDQYLILSLPNSGTDWLCPILAEHGGLHYYRKEFFNPITNPQYGHVLEAGFGCELPTCHRNIGRGAEAADLEAIYRETWLREEGAWNFDKEVYSPLKVEFFARHFRIAFLHRPVESVFPPSRLRVWAWYDAIYCAFLASGRIGQSRGARPLAVRARIAHHTAWAAMREAAVRLDAPVLDYDLLCQADAATIRAHLSRGWIRDVVDVEAAVASILATRRHTDKTATPPRQSEAAPTVPGSVGG